MNTVQPGDRLLAPNGTPVTASARATDPADLVWVLYRSGHTTRFFAADLRPDPAYDEHK